MKAAAIAQTPESDPHLDLQRINAQRNTLLAALARQEPKAAIPELRRLLKASDPESRMFAAWVLKTLGENDGQPTLNAFVDRLLDYRGSMSLFEFRSSETDDLVLERMQQGLSYDDTSQFRQSPWYVRAAAMRFFNDHALEMARIIQHHLESGDASSAASANNLLDWYLTSGCEFHVQRFTVAEHMAVLQKLLGATGSQPE